LFERIKEGIAKSAIVSGIITADNKELLFDLEIIDQCKNDRN
jgi:hypothetical protein